MGQSEHGRISTYLDEITAVNVEGTCLATADRENVALGIPDQKIKSKRGTGNVAYRDKSLGRSGIATEAARPS